jgi:hypothetical protein
MWNATSSRRRFLTAALASAVLAEVVHFAQDHWLQDGLWGFLMRCLSRLLGTEEAYADKDLKAAKNGAAFIAVHCPSEKIKTHVWRLLETINPLVARYLPIWRD